MAKEIKRYFKTLFHTFTNSKRSFLSLRLKGEKDDVCRMNDGTVKILTQRVRFSSRGTQITRAAIREILCVCIPFVYSDEYLYDFFLIDLLISEDMSIQCITHTRFFVDYLAKHLCINPPPPHSHKKKTPGLLLWE